VVENLAEGAPDLDEIGPVGYALTDVRTGGRKLVHPGRAPSRRVKASLSAACCRRGTLEE
jgi:hypothetical protein